MLDIEEQVLQAISRVTHRQVKNLSGGQKLRQDLGLDSLNFMELEYELQQGGFSGLQIEDLAAMATIAEVVEFLKSK